MEEANKVGFFQSSFLIKFLKNKLEVFKIKDPVLHFFLLELRVTFNSIPSCINKSLGVTKIFLKKSLEISLG